MTREDIIKGLECCATNRLRREDCEAINCTYLDLEGHGCIHQLIRDALALLKALDVTPDELERLKMCRAECKIDCLLEHYNNVKDELDAMEKAQEPRVMTLEELITWQKKPIVERDPIYVEYREGKGFGAPHWAQDNFGFNVASCSDNYRSGAYGMLIRCWTSRPDEKRRTETPWKI